MSREGIEKKIESIQQSMKRIIIEQQELIVLLRNKLAKLRGKYGETLKEYEL